SWKKNLGMRAGSVLVAGLAALGFYGLVQSNPPHQAATADTSGGSQFGSAPANPTPIAVQPGLPGGLSGGAAPRLGTVDNSGPAAPIVQPHTRTRGS
ncbi:MAG: hypothetical protein ACYDCQ_13650, partial [Dehalococcoidia bacterium]